MNYTHSDLPYDLVVLEYSTSIMEPTGAPCMIVVKPGPPSGIGNCEVWLSSTIDGFTEEIREYLLALSQDWMGSTVEESQYLMQRLRQLAIGPLRVLNTGTFYGADVESAIREAGVAGRWNRYK